MTWGYVVYSYILLPLLAIAYVALCGWLIWRMVSRQISGFAKLALVIAISSAFVLIPTSDVIVGRTYFSNLCQSEAGVKVVRPVVLESMYRRPDGMPKIGFTPGQSSYIIGDKYEMRFSEKQRLNWPKITEVIAEIRDTQRNELLGQQIDFHYWGGWLTHQLPGHIRADTCPQLQEQKTTLERLVFEPAK